MKKYKKIASIAFALSLMFWGACTEEHAIVTEPSDFDVTTTATTYKVGETVQFDFKGNPDMILFYSGELGARYDNRSRIQQAGVPKLVFQNQMVQGALGNGDTLNLLIAENLQKYDSASLLGAAWKDITARNTKWAKTLSTTFVTSDSIDLSAYNAAQSVSIAFKVTGKKNATTAQRKWGIQNLTLTNTLSDGTVTPVVSTFAQAGWVQLSVKNFTHAWDVGTTGFSTTNALRNTSGITMRSAYPISFDPTTTVGTDDNEDWLITSPIELKTVKPDAGIVVKNTVGAPQKNYKYIFRKAGTYSIVFVAQNGNNLETKTSTKQVQLTIQ